MAYKNYTYKAILDDGSFNPLKEDECLVVALLCNGERIDDISKSLCKSRDTINLYIKNAKKKLSANTRDHLVAIAVAKKIVSVVL